MNDRVTWGEGAYAGFWQRVAGRLIDWIIVGMVTMTLAAVLAVVFGIAVTATGAPPQTMPQPGQETGLLVAIWIALLLPDFLYDTLMTSRLGWTVGKRAVGVEVRRQDGTLLSFGQAAGRYFGRIVSSIPLNLGFLWAAWDKRKQTWHDKFVRCYVLKREYLLAPAAAPVEPAARPWGGYGGWGIPGAAQPQGPAPATAPGAPGLAGPVGPPPSPGRGPEPEWGARDHEPGQGARSEPEPEWGARSEPEPEWGARREPEPPPDADRGPEPEAPGPAAPPPAEPAGTDWARELGWDAGEPAAGPSLQGDSIESARWTESTPTPGAGPASGAEPSGDGDGAGGLHAPGEPQPGRPGPVEAEPGEHEPRIGHERAVQPEQPRGAQEAGSVRASSTDPNVVAIGRAAIPAESAGWLQQVADQVDSRLDRVESGWRSSPQVDAARACAFGLLLGHLAAVYPHMEDDLDRVAEAHPSFSTLGTGGRLATLQQIAGDHARATAWLGPLIGTEDREQVRRLFD